MTDDREPFPELPWPGKPNPPTLEQRVRRIELALWRGGEPPQFVIDATIEEPGDPMHSDEQPESGQDHASRTHASTRLGVSPTCDARWLMPDALHECRCQLKPGHESPPIRARPDPMVLLHLCQTGEHSASEPAVKH